MPKPKRKRKVGIPPTHTNARAFEALYDILAGAYGQKAQDYFCQITNLMREYQRLIDKGVNVKISHKRNGRSLLIIEK